MNTKGMLTNSYRRYYQKLTPLLKQRKVQALTMIILSIFSVSFFSFFAIRPTIRTIVVLQKQIEDRSLVDEQLEQKINALIEAQTNYQEVEPLVPVIYSLLPDTPNLTSLLIKLEGLTQDTNATISAISVSPVILSTDKVSTQETIPDQPQEDTDVLADEDTNAIPFLFSVSYSGTYEELKSILQKLISTDRIVFVNNLELKTRDTNSGGVIIQSMDLQGYYFPLDTYE